MQITNALCAGIPDACAVLKAGFHRSNDQPPRQGLFYHNGAPETFDIEALV